MTRTDNFSQEKLLEAHQQIITRFGYNNDSGPGQMNVLGWDIEYVCGPALANFIDALLIRRLNDFFPDNTSPTIIDCGANIGFSVLNYQRQFPDAHIIAFEPDPDFLPVLRRNLSRNGAENVVVVEAAVWVEDGESQWYCEGIDGSQLISNDQGEQKSVTVRTMDFANFLSLPVDLVKLDIEGSEYRVVNRLFSQGKLGLIKNMIIECHIDQSTISLFGKMLEELHQAGFQVGINSMGRWVDLIRQPEILPYHHSQYLTVAVWREPNKVEEKETDPNLPIMGVDLLIKENQILELQNQLETLQAASQRQRNEIEALNRLVESSIFMTRRVLSGPFVPEGEHGWVTVLPDLEPQADNLQLPSNSRLLLFEDDTLLGPAHALHDDIRAYGGGRYSHWLTHLYFSASDNTDPNINRRVYTILYLDPARLEAQQQRSKGG